MKEGRYTFQIDFYFYAKSHKGAVRLGLWLVRKICNKFDNQARLTGVWFTPFASFNIHKIEDDRINEVLQ